MDWSIQEVARHSGTTSRRLRHYDDIGLLAPSAVGANGYRRYDERALVRLQRILLLRELGLSLPDIAGILDRAVPQDRALEAHLSLLREEQDRLARRITAVQTTIDALREGERLVMDTMFDGFDHTEHREEVERRWGTEAYRASDDWWRGLDDTGRRDQQRTAADLARDWTEAATSGVRPDSAEAAALAARHIRWLAGIPGTPAAVPDGDLAGYVRGLADMYVADPRFAANYGGQAGAEFVRDALFAHLDAGQA